MGGFFFSSKKQGFTNSFNKYLLMATYLSCLPKFCISQFTEPSGIQHGFYEKQWYVVVI